MGLCSWLHRLLRPWILFFDGRGCGEGGMRWEGVTERFSTFLEGRYPGCGWRESWFGLRIDIVFIGVEAWLLRSTLQTLQDEEQALQ